MEVDSYHIRFTKAFLKDLYPRKNVLLYEQQEIFQAKFQAGLRLIQRIVGYILTTVTRFRVLSWFS